MGISFDLGDQVQPMQPHQFVEECQRQPQVAFYYDNSNNFGSCDSRLCKSQIRGFWRMRNQQKSPLDNRGGTEYQRFIQETDFHSF